MCGRLGVNPTGIFQKIVSLSAGQLLGAGMTDTRYRSDCFVSMQHKNTGEERILKVE